MDGTMEAQIKADSKANNQAVYDYLDELTGRRFYGEVTLFFQSGNIESSRQTERLSKSDIQERMGVKKRLKKVFLPRPSASEGSNG